MIRLEVFVPFLSALTYGLARASSTRLPFFFWLFLRLFLSQWLSVMIELVPFLSSFEMIAMDSMSHNRSRQRKSSATRFQ